MSPVSNNNSSRADQRLGSAEHFMEDAVFQASGINAVNELSSVIDSSPEEVSERNDSGHQVPDQDAIDESGVVPVSTDQQKPVISRQATITELHRLAALLDANIESPVTLSQIPNASLMGVPAEVRIMIYEMLLINLILGEVASSRKHDRYGVQQAYDLHPAVLGVCKQIQKETIPILYGRNPFCVVCLPVPGPTWSMQENSIVSPFPRNSSYASISSPLLSQLSSVCFMKKWKVILSAQTWHDYDHQPSCSFLEVCRAISRGNPSDVDIAIIPKGIEDGVFEYQNMEVALKPLGLLRRIENFQIRDTTLFEIPNVIRPR